MGIAAEHLQGTHVLRIGGLRPGRAAAGGFRQREQLLQELRGGFGFLAVLRGDTDFLEERLEVEPLLHVERRHVHVEAGDAHLILRERLRLRRLAIDGGAKVAGDQHDEQRAINGVLRPAKWCGSEVLANVLALLAGPNEIEHATADGVLGDIARVPHLRKRAHIAGAGAGDDLSPVGVIGLGELREKPLQGAACGIPHLIGQFDAVGLLPAAEKDLRAANDLTEQFLNTVLGDLQMGLDGLARLDSFRRRGRPMGVQSFLRGDLRGNGLSQFLVMEPWQEAEQQGAVDPGGTSIIQDRFIVVAPSIPHPKCDLLTARSWTA